MEGRERALSTKLSFLHFRGQTKNKRSPDLVFPRQTCWVLARLSSRVGKTAGCWQPRAGLLLAACQLGERSSLRGWRRVLPQASAFQTVASFGAREDGEDWTWCVCVQRELEGGSLPTDFLWRKEISREVSLL